MQTNESECFISRSDPVMEGLYWIAVTLWGPGGRSLCSYSSRQHGIVGAWSNQRKRWQVCAIDAALQREVDSALERCVQAGGTAQYTWKPIKRWLEPQEPFTEQQTTCVHEIVRGELRCILGCLL